MNQPLDHLGARFSGLWVRQQLPHGQVLGGRDDTGAEVTVAVLTGAAATDPRLRNAFADIVWRHSVGSGAGRPAVAAADVTGAQPWAAVQVTAGAPGAERLLTELGEAAGGGAAYGGPPPPPPVPSGLSPASPGAGPHYQPTSTGAGDTAPVVYAPMGAAGAPTSGAQSGPPAPASAPSGYGYPPTGHPPHPPARSGGRTGLVVGLIGGFLALVMVAVCGVVVWAMTRPDATDSSAQAGPDTPPTSSQVPVDTPGPTAPTPSQPAPSGTPQLRPLEPLNVLGATFPRNADTYTMAFRGWPFAFRTPGSWGCIRGTVERWPDDEFWQCVDEGGSNPDHIVVLTLWECPDGCTQHAQQELLETWLDFPDRAVRAPSTPTYYVENEYRNDDDRLTYSVDLSHFAAGPTGGELRWMVGVYGESPHDGRQIVQQIINDIITQAG